MTKKINNIKNKNLFYRTFANKKILITGHTGFKESWISFWLKELHDGIWQCMDAKRDKDLLNELEASGRAPWKS